MLRWEVNTCTVSWHEEQWPVKATWCLWLVYDNGELHETHFTVTGSNATL